MIDMTTFICRVIDKTAPYFNFTGSKAPESHYGRRSHFVCENVCFYSCALSDEWHGLMLILQ